METRKEFYRKVLILILPIALQNLINVGISSMDVIMLGRVGENVLSGASLGSQINFIMSLLLFGIMSGASVLIAQYWGKRELTAIEKVFGMAMKISACVGICFMVVTLAIPELLMSIFTNDSEVIAYGAQYLQIVCFSYLLIPVTMTYLNTMRSMERVKIATVVYLTSMIVNFIVNAVLIFGLAGFPAIGVRGAAVGTVTARMVEVLIIVIYDKKINDVLPFHFSYLFLKDSLLWKDFMKYSLPVMANELFWGAGVASISAIVGHLGSAAVAANSVAQVVRQLAMVISFGVGSAAAIMIGKVIGEGKKELAADYGKKICVVKCRNRISGHSGCADIPSDCTCRACAHPAGKRILKLHDVCHVLFCNRTVYKQHNCSWNMPKRRRYQIWIVFGPHFYVGRCHFWWDIVGIRLEIWRVCHLCDSFK